MVAETAGTADRIASTLVAHGIEVSTAATGFAGAYPTVDWVRGYHVEVPADEFDPAREILDALADRSDVATVDQSNVEGDDSAS